MHADLSQVEHRPDTAEVPGENPGRVISLGPATRQPLNRTSPLLGLTNHDDRRPRASRRNLPSGALRRRWEVAHASMETYLSGKPSSLSPPLGAPDPQGRAALHRSAARWVRHGKREVLPPPSFSGSARGAQRAADLNIRPRATAVPTRALAVVHQDSDRPQWLDSPRRLAALEDRSRRALDSGSVPSETGKAERTEPLVRVATHLWPRRAGRPLCGGCDAPLSPISDSQLNSRASTGCHTNRSRASRHALEPGWRPGATRPPSRLPDTKQWAHPHSKNCRRPAWQVSTASVHRNQWAKMDGQERASVQGTLRPGPGPLSFRRPKRPHSSKRGSP